MAQLCPHRGERSPGRVVTPSRLICGTQQKDQPRAITALCFLLFLPKSPLLACSLTKPGCPPPWAAGPSPQAGGPPDEMETSGSTARRPHP